MFSLNLRGRILLAEHPLVMGILNATPDSFHAGSRIANEDAALSLVEEMIAEGVDMIDIGGQSTRPGSTRIGPEAEKQRILPLIRMLKKLHPDLPLSVDTYHADVAAAALDEGADIINDISGGDMDPMMLKIVGRAGVPFICTHMQGQPETMQENPVYEDVLSDVMAFFRRKSVECREAGIHDLIIDPGFGFGKTLHHNYRLLSNIEIMKTIGYPLLIGVSRKSMIREVLGISTSDALNGTSILHTIALMKGADILRVHDVKEAREAVLLVDACRKN